MLAAAGLDMALMEVSDGVTMQVAKASRLLTTDAIFAWDAH